MKRTIIFLCLFIGMVSASELALASGETTEECYNNYQHSNISAALHACEILHAKGDAKASYYLARLLFEERGNVKPDWDRAIKLFNYAAKHGEPQASFFAGLIKASFPDKKNKSYYASVYKYLFKKCQKIDSRNLSEYENCLISPTYVCEYIGDSSSDYCQAVQKEREKVYLKLDNKKHYDTVKERVYRVNLLISKAKSDPEELVKMIYTSIKDKQYKFTATVIGVLKHANQSVYQDNLIYFEAALYYYRNYSDTYNFLRKQLSSKEVKRLNDKYKGFIELPL